MMVTGKGMLFLVRHSDHPLQPSAVVCLLLCERDKYNTLLQVNHIKSASRGCCAFVFRARDFVCKVVHG
jgi:hypothetical protein